MELKTADKTVQNVKIIQQTDKIVQNIKIQQVGKIDPNVKIRSIGKIDQNNKNQLLTDKIDQNLVKNKKINKIQCTNVSKSNDLTKIDNRIVDKHSVIEELDEDEDSDETGQEQDDELEKSNEKLARWLKKYLKNRAIQYNQANENNKEVKKSKRVESDEERRRRHEEEGDSEENVDTDPKRVWLVSKIIIITIIVLYQ